MKSPDKVMKKPSDDFAPRARAEGLVVRDLEDEVLIYDLERHRAVCLNRAAALVWKHCDGETGVAALARLLRSEAGTPRAEDAVWLALARLGREGLLQERVHRPSGGPGLSRRELMRAVGFAAAASLPVVTSILAPTAAQAASCLPSGAACTAPAECCSGLCPGAPQGTCV